MRTFKTQIYPTAEQQEYIRKACGTRRWTWNWAVATYFAEAKKDNFLSAYKLQKILNKEASTNKDLAWLNEVNSMVRGEALKDLNLALSQYAKARQRAKRTADKQPVDKYKPGFKKKGKCTESFRLFKKCDSVFKVHSAHDFSVVTTRGHERMHIHPRESLEFLMSADIKTCTFSMKGGKFFVSITYEKTNQRVRKCGTGKAGLDLGIHHAITVWDGQQATFFDVPEQLKQAEKRTERCNQRLAHTQKGSKRHAKALQQLQRAYMHEANVKQDWREKLTTHLVATYGEIVIDDFGFQGALNLKKSNRALYRTGCYAFKTRLQEKAAVTGCKVRFVEPFTPTSKTCSGCGAVNKDLALKDRTYTCPSCGLVIDRDVNGAVNAYKL